MEVGITYVNGKVSSGGAEERVRFWVDSGIGYTLLPERVWKSLGLKPTREMDFFLADGTTVSRGIYPNAGSSFRRAGDTHPSSSESREMGPCSESSR